MSENEDVKLDERVKSVEEIPVEESRKSSVSSSGSSKKSIVSSASEGETKTDEEKPKKEKKDSFLKRSFKKLSGKKKDKKSEDQEENTEENTEGTAEGEEFAEVVKTDEKVEVQGPPAVIIAPEDTKKVDSSDEDEKKSLLKDNEDEKKSTKSKKSKKIEGPKFEFYNAEKGTVLGRNLTSWLKILAFYICYFTFLAGLFTASVQLMEKQLPRDKPMRQTRLNVPGIHYFPKFDLKNSDEKSRFGDNDGIAFAYNDGESTGEHGYDYYVNATQKVMDTYTNSSDAPDHKDFNLETLGPCSPMKSGYQYGWDNGTPCIYFRINRVIDWEPVGLFEPEGDSYFNLTGNLPTKPIELDATYIRCMAKTEDNEEIEGEIFKYYGGDANGGDGYISKEFFPYKGKYAQPAYESPIVAVQIVGLGKGQAYKVRCAAYGASFLHDGKHREGEITFYYKVNTEPEPTVEPEVATNGTEVVAESSGDEDETAR